MDKPKCRWCGNPIRDVEPFHKEAAPTKSGWSYMHLSCEAVAKQGKKKRAKVLAALNQ